MKQIFINNIKNKYLQISFVIIFLIFSFTFLTVFLIYKFSDDFSNNSNLENTSFLMNYEFERINWIMWILLTPLLIISPLLTSYKLINKSNNYYFGIMSVVKFYCLYLLINILYILVFIISFHLVFFGFFTGTYILFINYSLSQFIGLIITYLILSVIIYAIYIITNLKTFVISSSVLILFALPVINFVSNLNGSFNSGESYQYKYTDNEGNDTEISFSNYDVIMINDFLNHFDVNYNDLEKNKEEIKLKLNQICSSDETNIYIEKEYIHYICKLEQKAVEANYQAEKGVNLIWKNILNNEDGYIKYGDIIEWFKEPSNYEIGVEKIHNAFEDFEFDFVTEGLRNLLRNIYFDKENIIKVESGNASSEYESLVIFLKNIFYYYLINYIEDPLKIDEITKHSFGFVIKRFLNSKIFDSTYFNHILNSFLWLKPETRFKGENEIIVKSGYSLKNLDLYFKNYYNPIIYANILNLNGINLEQFAKLKKFRDLKINQQIFSITNYPNNIAHSALNYYKNKYIRIGNTIGSDNFINKIDGKLLINNLDLQDNKQFFSDNKVSIKAYELQIIIFVILYIIGFSLMLFSTKIKSRDVWHSRSFPVVI
ncbi:hypothetical protein SCHIN_v1c04420 [Spiroplasma chinense]|uniref:Uncharacterized protein n=1 Tax=Spiroplasma chinense TaxID=216932 RepID=A0A5B9Y4M8_9MOLU|nr:hypothetical protein [Spiroplasma chinense]QEH61639.1 hypothetical protein SCHIN_v1c04420 [Spiroplasma chinense]